LGEGAPDFFGGMGEFFFDDDGACGGNGHGSILLSRSSRRAKRSGQKRL
jgi:hypothetical protein